VSAGGTDVFLAKLDPQGGLAWAARFGDAQNQFGYAVAVTPTDDILLAGQFKGSMDFGGGPLSSAGGSDDAYVVRLGAGGSHLWSAAFGDFSDQKASAVACDSLGDIAFTGAIQGSADFGSGLLTSAGGWDAFVAKRSPAD
jgi:hypothetical protein